LNNDDEVNTFFQFSHVDCRLLPVTLVNPALHSLFGYGGRGYGGYGGGYGGYGRGKNLVKNIYKSIGLSKFGLLYGKLELDFKRTLLHKKKKQLMNVLDSCRLQVGN
jgi:hypothetical protein